MSDNDAETQHCTGCSQDKPLQQFQVIKTKQDGTTWVKTRKWCLACCNALTERQERSDGLMRSALERRHEEHKARQAPLGPLPAWCNVDAVDHLINGAGVGFAALHISGSGVHERRAGAMALLWQAFQRHERETGEPLGGRSGRFIKAMVEILGEDDIRFRQKLKRMGKHVDDLMGLFETASTPRPRKLRPAPFP